MRKMSVITFILASVLIFILILRMEEDQKAMNQKNLETAIQNALTLCYAQEGFYPAQLNYLIENYGIIVDDAFVVTYKAFASNFRPTIHIYRIGGTSE